MISKRVIRCIYLITHWGVCCVTIFFSRREYYAKTSALFWHVITCSAHRHQNTINWNSLGLTCEWIDICLLPTMSSRVTIPFISLRIIYYAWEVGLLYSERLYSISRLCILCLRSAAAISVTAIFGFQHLGEPAIPRIESRNCGILVAATSSCEFSQQLRILSASITTL